MEGTQLMAKLTNHDEFAGNDAANMRLLHFPQNIVPESTIVTQHSVELAFIKLHDKYLGKNAEWSVKMQRGTQEEALDLYRRLKSIEAKVSSDLSPDAQGPTRLATGTSTPREMSTMTCTNEECP